MSCGRMDVPPFLASKLVLVHTITQLPFGISLCAFKGMSIRSRRCVKYNDVCVSFICFIVMPLLFCCYFCIYILVHSRTQ